MFAITASNELFSHAGADEVASAPLSTTKASHENLFSQPSTDDAGDVVARPKALPRNPFQVS
ncbi:hypothetical protein [Actinocrispum wychmicini]|uniref:Uncharacterized protein n=1 Tax=Actinocrispum wychmicini TaxID=1213861 RepID=A0A4R2JNM5_9PSEU|nr:hypothetical protein [Actinocrispum wychmicini]TCO58738.1 hypothetical protein EV192_105810 [Actinocrispum wychmicini]